MPGTPLPPSHKGWSHCHCLITHLLLSQPTRERLGKEPADCEEEELGAILVRV